jgi:hypothetical protein
MEYKSIRALSELKKKKDNWNKIKFKMDSFEIKTWDLSIKKRNYEESSIKKT